MGDDISIKSHIQSLEATHKKSVLKQTKIKHSLEDIINDNSLPSHLRTKLTSLLPNFYTSHTHRSESSFSIQMKLEILSDNEDSQPLSPTLSDEMIEEIISPIPKKDPMLLTSASASLASAYTDSKRKRNSKLLNFRRRTPKKIRNKHNHRRSASTVSYKSFGSESEQHSDEEKEFNLTPKTTIKRSPSPRPKGNRPKPRPPPRSNNKRRTKRKVVRRPQHPKYATSDDLTKIAKTIQINPKTKNLALIDENQQSPKDDERIRSVSEYIASPSSTTSSLGSSMKCHRGSPLKISALDTSMNDENIESNHQSKKRILYERKNKNMAFDFHQNSQKKHHQRSKSSQQHNLRVVNDTDSSDFSTDTENVYDPFSAKRKQFFHSNIFKKNIGNKSKKNKKNRRRESIKVSKNEEQNLTQRRKRSSLQKNNLEHCNSKSREYKMPKMEYSKSAQMNASKHPKRNSLNKLKPTFLSMSNVDLTDAMSESPQSDQHQNDHYQSININPLSPINPKIMDSSRLSKVLRFNEVKKLSKITG